MGYGYGVSFWLIPKVTIGKGGLVVNESHDVLFYPKVYRSSKDGGGMRENCLT